ncbi:MAG: DUF1476 family protein [Alphaproteobacteria bacterium]|jgi:hypothetical protein|nr:DUF1476 family protein [Alphaproteobacteria bacterium]
MALDKRGTKNERKYEKDSELQFKISVRRNKLLGLWAAGRMGLDGAAAESYAKEVVAADFEEVGDEDVIRKIAKDFADKGVTASTDEIRRELGRAELTATDQMEAEQAAGS